MYINKQLLRPIEFADHIRLGRDGDGGYVVPRPAVERAQALVSFGVSDDWTFEEAFKRMNPKLVIEAYDPTVSYSILKAKAFRHLEKGLFLSMLLRLKFGTMHLGEFARQREIYRSYKKFFKQRPDIKHIEKWITAKPGPNSATPREILDRLVNKQGKTSIFLKMDIEGGEYDDDLIEQIAEFSDSIDCIVMECHDIDRSNQFKRLMDVLLKDYSVVHTHGNNISPVNENEAFPVAIELTFLSNRLLESQVRRKPSSSRYPLPGLDQPNTPHKPDIALVFD